MAATWGGSTKTGTAGRNIAGSGRLRSTLIRSGASPLAGARPASKRQKRYSCAIGRSAGLTRLLPRALLLSPAMSSLRSRTKAAAKAKPPRSWAITLIKHRGVLLGYVEAPDEKAAELVAAKAFMLNEWQRKRLLVRERI